MNYHFLQFGSVYGIPNAEMFKAKALRSLSVLEAILRKQGTTFAAGGIKYHFSFDISLLKIKFCA
jgi:hypothetical protein